MQNTVADEQRTRTGPADGPRPTFDLDLRYEDNDRCPTTGDVELYYEVRGEGPPITFLNHTFLVSPAWRSLTRDLEREFRLVTYDLRNQGASTRCEGKIAWADHVEDLRHLLDRVGLERTYLLGTSISTLICRDFALAYPERVAGLILVGPAFSPYGHRRRHHMAKTWLTALRHGGVEGLYDFLYPLVLSDYTQERGGGAMFVGLRDAFLALHSTQQIEDNLAGAIDLRDEPAKISTIACPTLLLVGDGDFLWSESSVRETARLLQRPTVVTIPRAGHLPYFEAADAFQAAVREFVRKCEAGS